MRRLLTMTVFMALAFALTFAFVGVKDASADSLLFPWVTKSATVSTLISVVNNVNLTTAPDQLHYQYWYKRTTANGQTELCDGVSFRRPITQNDVVTFDASGNINDGKALFNDSTAGTDSYKLDVAAPRRAFLLVDNDTEVVPSQNFDGSLYGEAMVLEIAGGAAWGYIAYNPTGIGAGTDNGAVTFYDGLDLHGEVINSPVGTEVTQAVLMPPATITTRFFMTPVDSTNQRVGTATTAIQLCITPTGAGLCTEGGVFDNDENKIDFEKIKHIVCTSGDDLSSLMTEAGYNALVTTAGQGWAYIVTVLGVNTTAANQETGMIIGKLEFTTAGITISGTAVPGTLNNFNWLRDNESVIVGLGGTSSGINAFE